jgi:hypothetical protein
VRKVANGLIYGLLLIALFRLVSGGIPPPHAVILVLERDLRTVQALMLIVFAGLVLYYAIPISRNLTGIALGYGCFISTSVFNLTLSSQFGLGFQKAWSYLQPLEYCMCVTIWCVTLWSLAPAPGTQPANCDQTYQAVSDETELRFSRLRAHIVRRSTEC